jgi:hypothetical protein
MSSVQLAPALHICFLFALDLPCWPQGRTMQILTWYDRRNPSAPRAIIQQGRCDQGQCGQFSISISNGERGLTVRFDSEDEFLSFLARGAVEADREVVVAADV